MTTRRTRFWAVAAAVAVLAGAGAVWWWNPLLVPGTHTMAVYALDDAPTRQVDGPPGFLGRLTGMCDADSYYVSDGDRHLCVVLNGPLGDVRASAKAGRVTVAAGEAARLRAMAAQDTGTPDPTTTLVLQLHGGPVAMIPVANLAPGRTVSATALD
jgi:hypothetical protein